MSCRGSRPGRPGVGPGRGPGRRRSLCGPCRPQPGARPARLPPATRPAQRSAFPRRRWPPRAAAGVSAETFRACASRNCVERFRGNAWGPASATCCRHLATSPLQPPRHLADPSGAGGHDHFPSGNTGVWGSGCSAFRSLAGAGWRGCCRGCRGCRGWRGGWDGWCPEGCSGAGRTGVTMITSCAVTTAAPSDQRGASGLRLGHERLAVRARATRGCGPGRLLAAPCCRRRSAC